MKLLRWVMPAVVVVAGSLLFVTPAFAGTRATDELRALSKAWEAYVDGAGGTAIQSGIVGDEAHVLTGGYHISRDTLRNNGMSLDYSIDRRSDKLGPGDAAAAIDMTMDPRWMKVISQRLARAVSARDPRALVYLAEFAGTTTGTYPVRVWTVPREVYSVSWDHMSHVHLSVTRQYVESPTMVRAILSLIQGVSWDDWKSDPAAPLIERLST